jgi:hypothetical protein
MRCELEQAKAMGTLKTRTSPGLSKNANGRGKPVQNGNGHRSARNGEKHERPLSLRENREKKCERALAPRENRKRATAPRERQIPSIPRQRAHTEHTTGQG